MWKHGQGMTKCGPIGLSGCVGSIIAAKLLYRTNRKKGTQRRSISRSPRKLQEHTILGVFCSWLDRKYLPVNAMLIYMQMCPCPAVHPTIYMKGITSSENVIVFSSATTLHSIPFNLTQSEFF